MSSRVFSITLCGKEFKYFVNKNGCWICVYPKKKDRDGYHKIKFKGRIISVSRFVYQAINGDLSSELEVRHTCDETECMNPDHLIPGCHKDNMMDKILRGRGNHGSRNGRAILTESTVRKIKKDLGKMTIGEVAIKHGVRDHVIRDIKLGLTWKHVA